MTAAFLLLSSVIMALGADGQRPPDDPLPHSNAGLRQEDGVLAVSKFQLRYSTAAGAVNG